MKVLIRVIRETEYASIVEMDKAAYDQLQKDLEGSPKERMLAEKDLNGRIDVKDWQDDCLRSVEEFAPATD